MIRLDSITILLPIKGVVKNICNTCFDEHAVKFNGKEYYKEQRLRKIFKEPGLKNIRIINVANEMIIELSSKILQDESYQLINKNNIDRVFSLINARRIVEINISKAINKAIVLKCDVTNDIKVKNGIPDYIIAISTYRCNPEYEVKQYQNKSIVFKKKAKTVYQRISFYDKFAKSREDIFRGILRVEQNLKNFKSIRQEFNIDKNSYDLIKNKYNNWAKRVKLISVLDSNENPNLKLLEKITESRLPNVISNAAGYKLNQLEKYEGRKQIIKVCNFDFNLIDVVIRKGSKGDISKSKREYRNLAHQMLAEQSGQNVLAEISEIRDLLKAQ